MIRTTAPQPLNASRSTAFNSTCEIVSNRSSGSKSGSQRPSAIPYSLSAAVPATAKSLGVVIQPILLDQLYSPTPFHSPLSMRLFAKA